MKISNVKWMMKMGIPRWITGECQEIIRMQMSILITECRIYSDGCWRLGREAFCI